MLETHCGVDLNALNPLAQSGEFVVEIVDRGDASTSGVGHGVLIEGGGRVCFCLSLVVLGGSSVSNSRSRTGVCGSYFVSRLLELGFCYGIWYGCLGI